MWEQLGRVLRRLWRQGCDGAPGRAPRARPRLELLEDRLAPAVFNVNSTADILAPPQGTVTLRSAIQAANATPGGNTINLTVPGVYGITIPGANEDNNATGDFDILPAGGNLTIQNTSGGAAVVDANRLDRVFDINPAATNNPNTQILVTMQGFTIQGGLVSGAGAPGAGGGIRVQGNSSLTLVNMIVANNSASDAGGGIGNGGNGAVTISASTVLNNFSNSFGGGLVAGPGPLTVVNSLFVGNTASMGGGGIASSGSSTTIINSQIERNTAAGGTGGGVNAIGPMLLIQNSTIDLNSAGGPGGGGIEMGTTGNNSAIINTTLFGNSTLAAGGTGGGIDAPAAFTGTVTLLNDTINGNFATSGGGVAWAAAGASKVAVQNTIIAANNAPTGPDANNPAGSNFTDAGGNLIGVSGAGSGNTGFTAASQTGTTASPLNPMLAGLAYYGGPIIGTGGFSRGLPTEITLAASPARDKGVATGLTSDERGFRRPVAALPDVGAVEFQNVTLAVNITPSASNVPLGSTVTFQVRVTNTSGNDLPDDASTVAVTLSPGLTPTSALTFTLGALPAGQSKTFSVTATANALGAQTANVTVTSPDANPSTVTASATVTGVPASPAVPTPVGALTLYAFGFGPGGGFIFFEVDTVGRVFTQGFSFAGPVGPVQFFANSLRIAPKSLFGVNGTIAGFQVSDSGQQFLIDIGLFNPTAFFNPFVFNALLAAL